MNYKELVRKRIKDLHVNRQSVILIVQKKKKHKKQSKRKRPLQYSNQEYLDRHLEIMLKNHYDFRKRMDDKLNKRKSVETQQVHNKIRKHIRKKKKQIKQPQRKQFKKNLSKGYYEYLDSLAWKEKRQLVIERCKNMCEVCEKKKVRDIHHLTYKHFGNEELSELLGVCRHCHNILEKEKLKN